MDDATFVEKGIEEELVEELTSRAEKVIMQVGEEYKHVFLSEYKRLMTARLGLKNFKESDFDVLFSSLLDTMEALELDFNLFFRRLSGLKVAHLDTQESREVKAGVFFYKDGQGVSAPSEEEGRKRVGEWLGKWRERVIEDWGESEAADEERRAAMKKVNPSFIPRGWILDEVIKRVEKDGERQVLDRIVWLAQHPFEESWAGKTLDGVEYIGDKEEETRWITEVPKAKRALQCSCSS